VKFSQLEVQVVPNLHRKVCIISCVSVQLYNDFSVFCAVQSLNDPQMSGKVKILHRVRSLLKVWVSSSLHQKSPVVFSRPNKNAKISKSSLLILCWFLN